MRIVLFASGTRGDVQPMIALGVALRAAGYGVRLLAGANFAAWIESYGLEIYPTMDMEALMRSPAGLAWVEAASPPAELRAMRALLRSQRERMIADTIAGLEGADLVLSGFTAEPLAQAVCAARGIPQISTALQPFRATRVGAASMLAPRPHSSSVFNLWAGLLAEQFAWSVAREVVPGLRARLGLPMIGAREYRRLARAIPALYAISPLVVPPIPDANAHATGYWFLHEPAAPPPALLRFLAAGEPPIYLGFGSMPSSDPARITALAADALARLGRRAVVARGWGGAATAAELPESIFPLASVPHDWLFPQMAALVHHGGAGTTAAGLAAGKPTLVVPHMADQPFWGRRVFELGVGPRPLPRGQLSADTLARRLDALLGTPRFATNAAALGERIRAEDGVASAVAWIERFCAARQPLRT